MPDPQTVTMLDPDGNPREISADAVGAAVARGFKVESAQEGAARLGQEARQEEYGTALGKANAVISGINRSLSFGLSDVAAGATDDSEYLQGIREVNPGYSTAGEIGGAVLSALPTGGESLVAQGAGKLAGATPAGMVTRLGARIAEAGEGSALGRIAGASLGGAVEGAAQGAGAYISDVALGDKELSADAFIGAMGKGALFGGAAGGALATSGEALTAVRRMFPKQEMTREVVQKAADEATAAVSDAVSDADATIATARQKMRDIRAQRAALDLNTKAELDAIAIQRARELADAQVGTAKANQEAALARAERAKAGGQQKTRKAFGGEEAAPPTGTSPTSWREFSSSKMGEYMKSEGGHAGAMRRLSEEWKALKSGGGPVAEVESTATALERQLAGMKQGIDAGMSLQDLAAQRPTAIGLKSTHVEDALNAHIAKSDPDMATLVRAVNEAEESKTAVQGWLDKYGGKQSNVGKFERSEAARATAESWKSNKPGYYSSVPEGEGTQGLARGRQWEFRGTEEERKAAEDAFYARQGGRDALEAQTKRIMPSAKEIASEVVDSPKVEDAIKSALGSKVKNIDADIGESAKTIGRMEAAQADLAEALGPEAPISAQARAKEVRQAQTDAAKKTAAQGAAVAEGAEKEAARVGLPSAGVAHGLAGKAMQVGDVVEALHMMGLPVPDPKDIPVIGPVLKMFLRARVLAKAFGRFGGKTVETAESAIAGHAANVRQKMYGAVDAMFSETAKGLGKVAPVSGGAAAVLGHSLFDDGTKREAPKGKAADLTTLYKARMEELSRATPDSILAMVKDKVRAADPDLVDSIAQAQIRKLKLISDKAPRPDTPDGMLGGLPWTPSRAAISTWVRYIEAADDPAGVMQRAAHGGVVTVEAMEAIKTVYPSLYLDAQKRAIGLLADTDAKLPYARRVQLSTIFDLPIDTASSPEYAGWLQSGYKAKPTPPPAPPMPAAPNPTIAADVNVGMRIDPSA